MKIAYKILWVEDERQAFNIFERGVKKILNSHGFTCECTRIESLNELTPLINTDGLKKFDLLFVDFMLDNSSNGNDVIQRVRSNNIYTDVIFYSSKLDVILDTIQINKLEGIYTSDRTNLVNKFENIFKKNIKKIQEVNTIRGLLMAETSDLDELMVEIIRAALQGDSENKLNDYILDEMKSTVNNNSKEVNSEEAISKKITDSRIFTSFHKAKAINKIYKLYPRLENEKFFYNYENDVLKIRNIFGHVKEEDGKLVSTQTGEKEVFNEERCIEIRKNLIKYREQLEKLKRVITSQNED